MKSIAQSHAQIKKVHLQSSERELHPYELKAHAGKI